MRSLLKSVSTPWSRTMSVGAASSALPFATTRRGYCGCGSNNKGLDDLDDTELKAVAHHIIKKRPASGQSIDSLLSYNKEWSEHIKKEDPNFFPTLAKQQTPQYLWIGCSDSRVPANQIVGLAPGEVFVHRNVANVVARSDLNCLSVLQFAVEHLKVEHVIVCGHYNCGGVMAAYNDLRLGLVDNWVRHVVDVKDKYLNVIESLPKEKQVSALCELNVLRSVSNVVDTSTLQEHWKKEGAQPVTVHGWCYGLSDGIIQDLMTINKGDNVKDAKAAAVKRIAEKYSQ